MNNLKIAILGMGYVGLPLAVLFAKKYPVIGYDINHDRIIKLNNNNFDFNMQVDSHILESVKIDYNPFVKNINGLYLTYNKHDIQNANIYIICVPTPTYIDNTPDMSSVLSSSNLVGQFLKYGDIVIYESTLYPGAVNKKLIPILEHVSKLKSNIHFYVGYSPERVNPGDKDHTIDKVKKIVSSSNKYCLFKIKKLYESIIKSDIIVVNSIELAEAAKILENVQRDYNIALMNEFTKIFDKIGLDINEVINIASTKWNFLNFRPGLVGGHCIGVDTYYLITMMSMYGFNSNLINISRSINQDMHIYIYNKVVNKLLKYGFHIKNCRLLLVGASFKSNTNDFRNNKCILLYKKFVRIFNKVDIYDTLVDTKSFYNDYKCNIYKYIPYSSYQCIIIIHVHDNMIKNFKDFICKDGYIYNISGYEI